MTAWKHSWGKSENLGTKFADLFGKAQKIRPIACPACGSLGPCESKSVADRQTAPNSLLNILIRDVMTKKDRSNVLYKLILVLWVKWCMGRSLMVFFMHFFFKVASLAHDQRDIRSTRELPQMIRKLAKLYSDQSDKGQQNSYFTGEHELVSHFNLDLRKGWWEVQRNCEFWWCL